MTNMLAVAAMIASQMGASLPADAPVVAVPVAVAANASSRADKSWLSNPLSAVRPEGAAALSVKGLPESMMTRLGDFYAMADAKLPAAAELEGMRAGSCFHYDRPNEPVSVVLYGVELHKPIPPLPADFRFVPVKPDQIKIIRELFLKEAALISPAENIDGALSSSVTVTKADFTSYVLEMSVRKRLQNSKKQFIMRMRVHASAGTVLFGVRDGDTVMTCLFDDQSLPVP